MSIENDKAKEKISSITMRKNDFTNNKDPNIGSIVILQTDDKKLTFNLKNEKEFLDKNNINSNFNRMRNSIKSSLQINNDLEKSINNLKEEKLENDNDVIEFNIIEADKKEEFEITQKNEVDLDYKLIPGLIENVDDNIEKNIVRERLEIDRRGDYDSGNEMTQRIPFTPGFETRVTNSKLSEDLIQAKTQIVETIVKTHPIKKSNHAKILVIQKGSNKIHYMNAENQNENEKVVTSNESEFPFRICFICDQFFLKDKIFIGEDCDHSFCRRCGKAFFEEKIEEGEKDFSCPVYKCKRIIILDIIKSLVSEKHFSVIIEDDTNTVQGILKNKEVINNFMKFKQMDSIKFYTQKHVLDINSNEPFFIFNKAKEQFCIKCYEPALYGKTGKYVVKCLNCYHTICKFCLKSYTPDHFEISSFNYCKVYFRRKLKKTTSKDKNFCKNFGFNILTFIASYLMIVLAVYKLISVFVKKLLFINDDESEFNFRNFVYNFLIIFLYILITPLMLLVIPYFPALITLLMYN